LSDLVYFLYTTFTPTMTTLPIINYQFFFSYQRPTAYRYGSGPWRSGGMLSSRPKKCRYAIPAHTVSLRALVRSVSSTFHHFPWPKITQTYKVWWGRWEMWVYQALISFANWFQVKSISYKLSRRIPSRLQWRCCVKISKHLRVGSSFRHFISSHVLWDGGSEIGICRF